MMDIITAQSFKSLKSMSYIFPIKGYFCDNVINCFAPIQNVFFMKKICLQILFLFPLIANAQHLDSLSTNISSSVIAAYFEKIDKEDFIYLVPFQKKELWGYLDKRTLQVRLPAVFDQLGFYKGEGYIGSFYDTVSLTDYIVTVDKSGKINFQISVISLMEALPPGLFSRAYSQNIEVLSSAEGNNGFQYTMDEDYIDITAYSDLYRSHNKNQPLLIPMKIDNKIVAIAGKKSEDPHLTSYGIIDPQGNTLSGFDFKHNRIIPIKGTRDTKDVWFLVQQSKNNNNAYSYLNHKGYYRLKNQLPQSVYYYYRSSQKDYPFYMPHEHTLGYILVENKIFDLYELKQEKQLAEEYQGLWISYAIATPLEKDTVEEKRKKAHLYIWVKKENKYFYIDLYGNEYLPID